MLRAFFALVPLMLGTIRVKLAIGRMISPKTNSPRAETAARSGGGPNSETVKPCYFVVIDERHITLKGATERSDRP
jgi:hypothetical protein